MADTGRFRPGFALTGDAVTHTENKAAVWCGAGSGFDMVMIPRDDLDRAGTGSVSSIRSYVPALR
jgi:hypothetical protein